jgi:hypothetical protein
MCAYTEIDVKESENDCILASGEGHGSRGETFQTIYFESPVSSSVERLVYYSFIHTHIICSKDCSFAGKTERGTFYSHWFVTIQSHIRRMYWIILWGVKLIFFPFVLTNHCAWDLT